MAKKDLVKKKKVQVAFDALMIEGGLLSPEWLSKIAQLQASKQTSQDYKIPKGLALRDEIGRYWRIAEALWIDYRSKTDGVTDTKKLTEEFVENFLKQCLSFEDFTKTDDVVLADHVYSIKYSAGNGLIPIIISSPELGLDSLDPHFGEEHRKRTAFGLLQEYLNASDKILWGITSDGEVLRIVRDNSSLTKPAWIESNIKRMFQESRFADFAAFWLMCHRTRFGEPGQQPDDCILEQWRNDCQTEGTRARDQLRIGVEDALESLGQGFISHADNKLLREDLQSGKLTTHAYFQELLRLVYRLIFLITIEEREILHPTNTSEQVKALYLDGYSVRRLRDRSVKFSAFNNFSDLWDSLKIVFKGLSLGQVNLGLPPLGGLFAEDQTPNLMSSKIQNQFLLKAILKLCWLSEESGVSRVNWRDMGPEELGSVYESLLELVPQVTDQGYVFSFARGDATKGNARKTSGSYYTPDNLVQSLLDTTLEPVIENTIKSNPNNTADALLKISIIDPACGSAHFLLAAARRLAGHVARLQVGGTPTSNDYRNALRQVISLCIYGVDRNPMAIELARAALWLETMTADAPLGFIDHHLVCGDALLGLIDFEVFNNGIPTEAFAAIVSDDKEICKQISSINTKKLNELKKAKLESSNQDIFDLDKYDLIRMHQSIEDMPDNNVENITAKKIALENYRAVSNNAGIKIAADMYVSAFLATKNSINRNLIATTDEVLRGLRGLLPPLGSISFIKKIITDNNVMHWKLQFPQVFARGGFDVVIGNPPWDKIQPEEEKFFANIRPDISLAPTAKIRKDLIESLSETDPETNTAWINYKQKIDATCNYLRNGGTLTYTGDGNLNCYRVFTEIATKICSPNGRVGLVVQTGIATDESGKEFFDYLISNGKLIRFLDFENRGEFFPDVHQQFRFCLITIGGKGDLSLKAEFGWLLRSLGEINEKGRIVQITKNDIALFNPNSSTCPIISSQNELELSRHIYSDYHYISKDNDNKYASVDFLGELFNMTRDSKYFIKHSEQDSLPLYEAKFLHQYDYRFATFEGKAMKEVFPVNKQDKNFQIVPKNWVSKSEVLRRASNRGISTNWFFGFRSIARSTDERTVIASIFPFSAVGNSINMITGLSAKEAAILLAISNSFVFDFCARQKISGSNVNIWIFKQLPMLAPDILERKCPWDSEIGSVETWLIQRVVALVYTSTETEKFAIECGSNYQLNTWNEYQRFILKSEINAAMFILYFKLDENGFWPNTDSIKKTKLKEWFEKPNQAITYILNSFPIVKSKDEKNYNGVYQTQDKIINCFESITYAMRTKTNFKSEVDFATINKPV